MVGIADPSEPLVAFTTTSGSVATAVLDVGPPVGVEVAAARAPGGT